MMASSATFFSFFFFSFKYDSARETEANLKQDGQTDDEKEAAEAHPANRF